MAAAQRYDVAVVGGGSAGVAAAWAAASRGARALLVERGAGLGGNVRHAWVHTICGLYQAASEGDAVELHPGLPRRLTEALRRADAAGAPERAGRVWVLPIEPRRYADALGALCRATPGLEVRTGCELVGARLPASDAEPVRLEMSSAREGPSLAEAAIAIDASGDAAATALAQADVVASAPEDLQLPSFIFRMDGVDRGELVGFAKLRVTHSIAGAVRDGTLPDGCESVLVRPGRSDADVYVTLNVPRPAGYDPLDDRVREGLETRARESATRIWEFLSSSRPEFRSSRLDGWPERLGVRETRRAVGRSELSREWVLEGRRVSDEVARSAWPIELWQDHRRAQLEYPKGACSIPLDALVSRSHSRLGVAGRCLSASHEALGALRVIGTALASGEAIGVAAARAADAGGGLDGVAPADVRDDIVRSTQTPFEEGTP